MESTGRYTSFFSEVLRPLQRNCANLQNRQIFIKNNVQVRTHVQNSVPIVKRTQTESERSEDLRCAFYVAALLHHLELEICRRRLDELTGWHWRSHSLPTADNRKTNLLGGLSATFPLWLFKMFNLKCGSVKTPLKIVILCSQRHYYQNPWNSARGSGVNDGYENGSIGAEKREKLKRCNKKNV